MNLKDLSQKKKLKIHFDDCDSPSARQYQNSMILKRPVFGIPLINYEDPFEYEDPIKDLIKLKRGNHHAANHHIAHLLKDNQEEDQQQEVYYLSDDQIALERNQWHKLASIIFSPTNEIKKFNEYVDKKISMEEKLHKFPFKDLQMTKIIEFRRKQEIRNQVKKQRTRTLRQLVTKLRPSNVSNGQSDIANLSPSLRNNAQKFQRRMSLQRNSSSLQFLQRKNSSNKVDDTSPKAKSKFKPPSPRKLQQLQLIQMSPNQKQADQINQKISLLIPSKLPKRKQVRNSSFRAIKQLSEESGFVDSICSSPSLRFFDEENPKLGEYNKEIKEVNKLKQIQKIKKIRNNTNTQNSPQSIKWIKKVMHNSATKLQKLQLPVLSNKYDATSSHILFSESNEQNQACKENFSQAQYNSFNGSAYQTQINNQSQYMDIITSSSNINLHQNQHMRQIYLTNNHHQQQFLSPNQSGIHFQKFEIGSSANSHKSRYHLNLQIPTDSRPQHNRSSFLDRSTNFSSYFDKNNETEDKSLDISKQHLLDLMISRKKYQEKGNINQNKLMIKGMIKLARNQQKQQINSDFRVFNLDLEKQHIFDLLPIEQSVQLLDQSNKHKVSQNSTPVQNTSLLNFSSVIL